MHKETTFQILVYCSGGYRISRRGRGPVRGGHGPPTQALFSEMYAKMKELGPHRGRAPEIFVCRSATVLAVHGPRTWGFYFSSSWSIIFSECNTPQNVLTESIRTMHKFRGKVYK